MGFGSARVPPLRDKNLEHLPFVVDCAPKVVSLAVDAGELLNYRKGLFIATSYESRIPVQASSSDAKHSVCWYLVTCKSLCCVNWLSSRTYS